MPVNPLTATPVGAVELVRDHLRAWGAVEAHDPGPYAELADCIRATAEEHPERAALLITGLASLTVAMLRAMATDEVPAEDVLDCVALGVMANAG